MRWLFSFGAVVTGGLVGATLFFFLAFACASTLGGPSDIGLAMLILAAMVLTGAMGGGAAGHFMSRGLGPKDGPPAP